MPPKRKGKIGVYPSIPPPSPAMQQEIICFLTSPVSAPGVKEPLVPGTEREVLAPEETTLSPDQRPAPMQRTGLLLQPIALNDETPSGLLAVNPTLTAAIQAIPATVVASVKTIIAETAKNGLVEGATGIDVDAGKDQDIFDINEALGLNLFEGDIKIDGISERNSIIGEQYRWPLTVPYYFEDSLEINAKGLILKAFERYRLKTCIDYKPWEGEANYISVFKGNGCYSSIGNRRQGKQQLSIGANCDRIATIQHEFLHALGFWHEQSRSDRDDYVTIIWDNIESGKENNFNKYNDKQSSFLNVPYDYSSVMHYSKTAFRNGTDSTIVTRIPELIDVIGQRMDFSNYDLQKLNRLYNCTSSLSFMDRCSFELNSICGMVQNSEDTDDWQHVTQAPAGPSSDFTNMGSCNNTGYFMHFSTRTGNTGNKARLESRILNPKRGFQCLQFYYYHNGNANDKMNIWIKEYTPTSPNGTLKFVETVQGDPVDYWQLYHVSLNMTRKFRVVFEAVKGAGVSNGGFSIDDINLSETLCPHHVWHIGNFTNLLNTSPAGEKVFSPAYLSYEGYSFQIALYVNGTIDAPFNLAIYVHLVSGPNDNHLQWPCPWKQVTMELMDQNPDIRQRMSNLRSITTDPTEVKSDGAFFWDRPNKVGDSVNGTYRGPGKGTSAYITHERLRSRDFIKGDDVYILLTMEDISHLRLTQSTPVPTTTRPMPVSATTRPMPVSATTRPMPIPTTTRPVTNSSSLCENYCLNDGICIEENKKPVCRCPVGDDWWFTGRRCETKGSNQDTIVIAVSSSVVIFVVMLIITIVSVCCLKKKYKKKNREINEGLSLKNVGFKPVQGGISYTYFTEMCDEDIVVYGVKGCRYVKHGYEVGVPFVEPSEDGIGSSSMKQQSEKAPLFI
ncbi:meprin A subunit beta [Rhinatrema bivittatum]|uniref:meprin A subunit beta n=1 Tax=Rhinatrema bivittatum TaxID=194408 RepID=UPI00112EACCE|nr:meprin A subunit beta [Rhinatrema bivittatum]